MNDHIHLDLTKRPCLPKTTNQIMGTNYVLGRVGKSYEATLCLKRNPILTFVLIVTYSRSSEQVCKGIELDICMAPDGSNLEPFSLLDYHQKTCHLQMMQIFGFPVCKTLQMVLYGQSQ